jgi:hypothetical protein
MKLKKKLKSVKNRRAYEKKKKINKNDDYNLNISKNINHLSIKVYGI